MTRRFDCHVHSRHSPDGQSDLAAYAAQVDAGVAAGIGFAEHYDFLPVCGAWEYLDEAAYQAEIAAWRQRGYQFWAGVEVDSVASETAAIRRRLQAQRFDFVIGSVHTLPSGGVSDRNIAHWNEPGGFDCMLDEYASEFLASLAIPEYDVIGHPGVFQRYLTADFLDRPSDRSGSGPSPTRLQRVRELDAALAEAAARSGKLIEVNSSGLFAPSRQTCATPFFLERFRAAGGSRITLASDAHAAANLRRGFTEARPILEGLGFHELWLPWDQSAPVPLAEYVGA
jgi:histidinol-phosphatase (PHP family)